MSTKRLSLILLCMALLVVTGAAAAQDAMTQATFTVRIENVSGQNTSTYADVGIAGIPVGATARRAAMPGEAFEFTVKAKPGDKLTFATMYGQSNDSFFGPGEDGIALFDDSGAAVNGDVSDQIAIWDAGTEVNEPLGMGANQAPRQASPDAGEVENGTVQLVAAGAEFPNAPDVIHVTLSSMGTDQIHVRVENLTAMAPVPTPISPIIYAVFSADQSAPFFKTGEADRGLGLERLAESGNPEVLGAALAGSAVMNVGASPGVFIIHNDSQLAPVFTTGEANRGEGLEAQAEDGNPTALSEALASMGMEFKQVGVFNMPVGADKPGPLMPGQAFEFSFTASPGDRLSFTEMFGQSNDLFFAPDENGIALFSASGTPIGGSITGLIHLWDAGTEVNQEPFVGSDQAPRQAAPNTGADENGVVTPIYAVTDGFTYPSVLSSLKVTITNEVGMESNMMSMSDMMMDDNMMMTPAATDAMGMMEATATPAS